MVSLIISAWALMQRLPGPVVAAVFLFVFGSAIWILNLLTVRKQIIVESSLDPQANDVPKQAMATDAQLVGPYLNGYHFRLVDLARDTPVIQNRTFENCTIYGPAMSVTDGCVYHGCSFSGNPSDLFIEVAIPRRVVGAIMLRSCVFRNCRLLNLGFIGPAELLRQMIDAIKVRS